MLALGRDPQSPMLCRIIVYQIIQGDAENLCNGLAFVDIWERFSRLP